LHFRWFYATSGAAFPRGSPGYDYFSSVSPFGGAAAPPIRCGVRGRAVGCASGRNYSVRHTLGGSENKSSLGISLVGALKGRYLKERMFSLRLRWYCTAHVTSDGTLPSRNTNVFTGLEFVTVSWLLLLGIGFRDLGLWS
jgi:hypothetical protein